MKIGLDIHGVLDTQTDLFVRMASLAYIMKDYDEEIHIITGVTITEDLINQLLSYNNGKQYWTHLVSIQDELMKVAKPISYNEKGRPVFEDELWDSFKGKYCEVNNIDVMFDDTERYKKYFISTKFVLVK